MRLDLPYMAFWSSSLCSTPQLSAKMSHNISQFMVTIDWFAGLVRIKYSFGWKQVWVNFKLLSQSSHLDGWQDSPGSSLAVHCVHGCMGRGGALAYLAAINFCHKHIYMRLRTISSVTNNHATHSWKKVWSWDPRSKKSFILKLSQIRKISPSRY